MVVPNRDSFNGKSLTTDMKKEIYRSKGNNKGEKIMIRKFTTSRSSFVFLSLALVIFFAIAIGGCGGGNNKRQSNNTENTPQPSVLDEVLDEEIIDSDGDGVPDVLDFDDIDQKYYGENDTVQDIKISSVPSRHYIRGFKDNVSFTVDLKAGTEYTIELSESAGISGVTEVAGYAYPIGNNVPDVEIINPQGTALNFLCLGTYDENHDASAVIDLNDDEIELSLYPSDNPYMICYTFTPSATGSYTIKWSRTVLDDVASTNDTLEHVPTLFIYEELRSGTERNEAGYYKRCKFEDEDGNRSDTISMTDIMALRKAYNSLMYDTLSAVWQLDGADNDSITENNWRKIAVNPNAGTDAQVEEYLKCFARLKESYGIFLSEDLQVNSKEIVPGEVDEDDEDDENEDLTTETSSANVISAAASGKLNANGTNIKQELYGIPYNDDFQPGVGYFAITGIQATRNAIKRFTLPPLNPNNPDKKNVITRYTASFVSSQEDREKISTTTTGASLAIGGFGLSASYSSTSKFKFGLTSTTFVIHYEEVENAYRVLDDEKYKLKNNAKKTLGGSIPKFRENYGDYFVGGYKYGGTYDAFISITTETTEQLEEVKKKLGANYSSVGKSVSADIANETKEVLKKNNATVTIEIRTAGIDTKSDPQTTTNVDAIGDVSSQLQAFRKQLKTSKPSDYQPVYVMLKRYRVLSPVLTQMNKNKDNGLIPIAPAQSSKIMNFNRDLLIMQSYYNVIAGLDGSKIDLEARDLYSKKYNNIIDTVKAYGNSFYMESNLKNMQAMQKKITNLSSQLKALGDRYAFYRLLVSAQNQEAAAANTTDVTKKPFGANGGTVGSNSFSISKAVTSDIAAGENKHDGVNQFA